MKIHRLVFVSEDESRTEIREKILTIPIKPGIKPGTEIVFPEQGDQNPTHIPGNWGKLELDYIVMIAITADVIFVTEERPHETFKRADDDLIMIANITLEEALLGTTVVVDTIDHRTIRIPITDIVR